MKTCFNPFSAVSTNPAILKILSFTARRNINGRPSVSLKSRQNCKFSAAKKNCAARPPAATTSNSSYRFFTFKKKERKQTLNLLHIPPSNLLRFFPNLDISLSFSCCNRKKSNLDLDPRFREVRFHQGFNCFS